MAPWSAAFFFFQAEDGIRDDLVTGVQTCALPILARGAPWSRRWDRLFDWAPCLPAQAGSSKHESWSVVEDRIDGWWNQRSTAGFTMRALVRPKKRFLVRKRKNLRPHKTQSPIKMEKCLLTTPTQL